MTGKNEGKPRRGGTSFFTSKASLVWSCMQAANLSENVLALRDAANEAAFLLGVLWRRGHAAAALALDALRRAHTRRRDEAPPRDVRRAVVRAPTNHPQAPPSNLRMHALQSFCFAHEMCRDCRRTTLPPMRDVRNACFARAELCAACALVATHAGTLSWSAFRRRCGSVRAGLQLDSSRLAPCVEVIAR